MVQTEVDGRHRNVLAEDVLGRLVIRDRCFQTTDRRSVTRRQRGIELGAGIDRVVRSHRRRVVRGEQRLQEVLRRRVVHTPAETERAGDVLGVDHRQVLGEGELLEDDVLDTQRLPPHVGHRLHPGVVTGTAVEPHGHSARIPASTVEQGLGFIRVVLPVVTDELPIARQAGRYHRVGCGEGIVQHRFHDQLTVDGHRQCLAQLLVVTELRVVRREAQVGE